MRPRQHLHLEACLALPAQAAPRAFPSRAPTRAAVTMRLHRQLVACLVVLQATMPRSPLGLGFLGPALQRRLRLQGISSVAAPRRLLQLRPAHFSEQTAQLRLQVPLSQQTSQHRIFSEAAVVHLSLAVKAAGAKHQLLPRRRRLHSSGTMLRPPAVPRPTQQRVRLQPLRQSLCSR